MWVDKAGGPMQSLVTSVRAAQVEGLLVQIMAHTRFFDNPTHDTSNTLIGNYHV